MGKQNNNLLFNAIAPVYGLFYNRQKKLFLVLGLRHNYLKSSRPLIRALLLWATFNCYAAQQKFQLLQLQAQMPKVP